MSYGVLSGDEIAEAVKRQLEYERLYDIYLFNTEPMSWWKQLRMRRLEKCPRIHIEGFDPTPSEKGGSLNPNSYNLRLAPELLVYQLNRDPGNAWASAYLDPSKDNPTTPLTIPESGLILQPGKLYLGHTVEWTETYNLVPYLDGRSSIGRLGMFCHITAGAGDTGFKGAFTVELAVIHPVKVYPNMSLCQISYATIRPGGRQYQGRYQNSSGVVASRFYLPACD